MKVTRETDYAIRAVLLLSEDRGKTLPVSALSEKMDLPRSFLAKILQKLSRAGIVESIRGASGGYRLKRNPSRISLYDLYKAVQGEFVVNECAVEGRVCSRKERCAVHPVWKKIEREAVREMKKHSIASLSGEKSSQRS
ncbi:MAG: Rrf2 family transcriptional regulator [Deltaproteobacteria bacterium]|nr:MAG: Rrf2 family transcriptional regulator [Deltaproteobacteria bacterium]